MSYMLAPESATVTYMLFDALGWLALFIYDHNHCRRILPYVNSVSLLTSGTFTVGVSYLFYNYVPGATNVYLLIAHAGVFVLYPTYLFYPYRARILARLMMAFGITFITMGLLLNYSLGESLWPLAVYLMLLPILYIFFHSGGRNVILRHYYKRPFWR